MGEESSESPCLFSISTEPEDVDNDRTGEILYHKEFSIFPEEDGQPQARGRFSCFNCCGFHSISDCPQQIDRSAVMKNKAAFMMQRKRQPGFYNSREFKRYHIEVEGIMQDEAAPGVISDELRQAMGLEKTQLPPYIYRMRLLGYPPGWLEEAKISHSGINMINSKGERVPDAEEEEGEIFVVKTKFDFSKIIDYPGYNVWPAPDTLNETDRYGAPQMEYSHSKTAFIELLKQQMEDEIELTPPVDMSIDMDAEEVEGGDFEEGQGEFLPPLPADNPPDLPPPPPEELPLPSDVEAFVEEGEIEEEDVEEGEIIKKENAKKGTKRAHTDDGEPSVVKSPRTSLQQDSVHSADVSATNEHTNSSSADEYCTPNQTLDSSFGRVISVEMGTPALKIHSPYTNLPPPEAFSKDITDVINFENLPNSTGKYKKLKDVLKNVRHKLNIFRANGESK